MKSKLHLGASNDFTLVGYFYIILMILVLLSIDQFYTLCKFLYRYNFSYFSGDMMNKICNSSYIEYETHRFHVNNDAENIKIKNDTNSQNHQDVIIYVTSLLMMAYITYSFVMLYGNRYFQANNITVGFQANYVSDMPGITKAIFAIHFLTLLYVCLLIPAKILKKHIKIDVSAVDNLVSIRKIFVLIIAIQCFMVFNQYTDVSFFSFAVSSIVFILYYEYFKNIIERSYDHGNEEYNRKYSDDHHIFYQFLLDIFGIHNKTVSMLVKPSVFIGFAYIVLQILYKSRTNENGNMFLSSGKIDEEIMLKLIVSPIVMTTAVILFVSVTKRYNFYINEYLLNRPNELYKKKIKNISNIFDEMIDNNMTTVRDDSVCKNVANSIHLTLYSLIFANASNGDEIFPHILPRLLYENNCEPSGRIYYNDIVEYLPRTYLQDNFFIKQGQRCNSIDNSLLNKMISYNTSEISRDIVINKLKFAVGNVLNNKTYNGKRDLIISSDYSHNNQITNMQPKLAMSIDKDTVQVIEDIADAYIAFVDGFKEYTNTMNNKMKQCNSSSTTSVSFKDVMNSVSEYNDEYSQNIKTIYINRVFKMIDEFFSGVNEIMTFRTTYDNQNKLLSKLVINNYNIFQDRYNLYRKDDFVKIYKGIVDDSDIWSGIEEIEEVKKDMYAKLTEIGTIDENKINRINSYIDPVKVMCYMLDEQYKLYENKYQYLSDQDDLYLKMYNAKKKYITDHVNNVKNFIAVINDELKKRQEISAEIIKEEEKISQSKTTVSAVNIQYQLALNEQSKLTSDTSTIATALQPETQASVQRLARQSNEMLQNYNKSMRQHDELVKQSTQRQKVLNDNKDETIVRMNSAKQETEKSQETITHRFLDTMNSLNVIDKSHDIEYPIDESQSKLYLKQANQTSQMIYVLLAIYILIFVMFSLAKH